MTLCIATGGTVLALAASTFTLSWVHSVEKTRWDEHWQVADERLEVVEARVRGSGAGIDLPENARSTPDGWIYRPERTPIPRLLLAASGATPSGWTLCAADRCLELAAEPGEPVAIWATQALTCDDARQP